MTTLLILVASSGFARALAAGAPDNTAKLTPADLSTIRGANYRGAAAADTTDYWRSYNAAETERDLTYAVRLKLNQLRVFVNDAAWQADKAAFRRNLVDLARACNRHRIGLMITIGETQTFIGEDGSINRDRIRALVTQLVDAVGDEPALAFWDASNEPDYNPPGSPRDRQEKRLEIARFIVATLHELDKKTPVTIGMAYERNMEALTDAVDVLSFHDYLSTRAAIADDIARAKAFAAKIGKQVINTEIGCIARANPYDVTLEEHMKARVGWYIWELMITRRWGNVHGVFYSDGTVRDPAIPAAMFGLFRNRSDNVVLENVNRENCVNSDIAAAQAWLDNPAGSWKDGLDAAEKLANLLEAAQLTAMREPPTRAIELLRQGPPNPTAMRNLIPRYISLLRPFERPGASAVTGVHPTTVPAVSSPTVAYPIPRRAGSRTPADTSTIRGANYCYAENGGHSGMWNNYSTKITERDLTYAQRLGINQIRCFITYQAYQRNPEQFRQNLLHLVRAADERGIGVMPVVGYDRQMQGQGYPGAEAWAKFLVDTLGKEPGLAFWDVYNEPDYPPNQPERTAPRLAFARHMAGVFRRLDGQTPVTIGFAYERTMEQCAEDVDVLVFHDYQQTREAVRINIEKAKQAAARARKQVMNDEMGCVCRANPYDMTIQEHVNARIGYYMWELMIVWDGTRGWGNVHGIFYPDGTIRDPSIPMAVMGIFRNRGPDVVLEQPDREGRVTREIADARKWLADPNADWNAGLDIAEVAANLLESAQLVPLRELPTRQVAVLRRGPENRAALRTLLEKDIAALQPHAIR
ncbi:MAG: hypothetical protein NTU53_21095 [Planctomycetota bacterium]|nr:hypothetical protein [Planctomycetota bacterium]